MHKWIGGDCGVTCLRCGMALDYRPDPADEWQPDPAELDLQADAAHALAFGLCGGPELPRAHHYYLVGAGGASGYSLDCAYGDSAVSDRTAPDAVALTCRGDGSAVPA